METWRYVSALRHTGTFLLAFKEREREREGEIL